MTDNSSIYNGTLFILNINIQGLKNSKNELELMLESNKLRPIVITLCEHWLTESNYYIANTVCNYRLVSINIRTQKQRGGACILVRNDVNATAYLDINQFYEESVFECVGVELVYGKATAKKTCLIITVYRSPSSSFSQFTGKLKNILSFLEKLTRKKSIFLCGDFNIDQLKDDNEKYTFNSILTSFNFKVTILKPTRITCHSKTCIDNIITNIGKNSFTGEVIELGLSDHMAQLLFIKDGFFNTKNKIISSRLLNSKGRLNKFSDLISKQDWSQCLTCETSNEAYDRFFSVFQSIFLECFPLKTFKSKNVKTKAQWMTKGLRISSINKKELYKKSKLTSDSKFLIYFKNYKKIYKKTIIAAKKCLFLQTSKNQLILSRPLGEQ